MTSKTWRQRCLEPLARLLRGDAPPPSRCAAGRHRIVLHLEELEPRLTPSATVQFSIGSETINPTTGTFSIPVTLSGAPSLATSTFASGFDRPFGLAFDTAGNLYVANSAAGTVSKVTRAGVVSTFASGFTDPNGLAFDAAGNLYVSTFAGNFPVVSPVDKVTPGGVVSTFVSIAQPEGLAFDASGNLYITNDQANTVKKVTPAGGMNTIFASGFDQPFGLAFDAAGNLYVSNYLGNTVSKVTPGGVVSTFASGFNLPTGLAFDASGNLYVANNLNGGAGNTVSEVTPGGVVSTFASGFSGPIGLAFDAGNLYVASPGDGTVNEVSTTVTVPFTLGGTAVSGTDYSGVNASPLVFAPGQTTAYITGTVLDDPDASKTLTITLDTPSSNATLGSTAANTLTIDEPNPVPTLTSISPMSATVGSSPTLTLTGSSFVNGSTADFNGTPIVTAFVNTTQLTAVIPASDLTTAGSDMITVVTAGPGGGTSAAQTLTVNNPAPTLTGISPSSAPAGSPNANISLFGAGFINGSMADFNGSPIVTTFVSASQLTAVIPAADLTAAGSDMITVVTTGPGGGTSAAQTFTVSTASTTTAVLKSDGSLWQYTAAGGLQPLSPAGTIRAISTVLDVHGQTEVFAITTGLEGAQYNNTLWEYASGGWSQQSSGAFSQISPALDSNGESIVFGLLTNGSLWQQSHTRVLDAGWSELSGNGTIEYISAITDASGNDHVYVLDTPQVGAQYANTLWEHIPAGWRQDSSGAFSSVSAGLNSAGQAVVYGILTNGQLWEMNPAFGPIGLDSSAWHELSGVNGLAMSFRSVQAAGPDKVFGIAQDQNTWEHTPTTNTELTYGLLASQLSATETASGVDDVFETLIDGSFWEYSTAFPGNHFMELLTGGVATNSTPE